METDLERLETVYERALEEVSARLSGSFKVHSISGTENLTGYKSLDSPRNTSAHSRTLFADNYLIQVEAKIALALAASSCCLLNEKASIHSHCC